MVNWCGVTTLQPETVHLAVTFLDLYVRAGQNIPRADFQRTGAACLLIASKIEEIYAVECDTLVEYSLRDFTFAEVGDADVTKGNGKTAPYRDSLFEPKAKSFGPWDFRYAFPLSPTSYLYSYGYRGWIPIPSTSRLRK
jgi:hypothetical protein